MPRMSKAFFETKAVYRDCVSAAGPMGMMVQKVDQGRFLFQVQSSNFVAECVQKAASTSLLLNGQRPGQYNSSLYDS